jgi:hypothetical protein
MHTTPSSVQLVLILSVILALAAPSAPAGRSS